jgi:hypothetical protein
MDNNQMQTANHIIEYLKEMDVDGETMEYILRGVGMEDQMLKQLLMKANDYDINYFLKLRTIIHDKGTNAQFDNQ